MPDPSAAIGRTMPERSAAYVPPVARATSVRHPFYCFVFNQAHARPCGHKGCARRVANKEAARAAANA